MSTESVTERPSAAASTPPPDTPGDTPGKAAPATRPDHRYDIDLLRLICSLAIILGHVGGECMAAVDKTAANGPAVYWVGLLLDSLTSWGVPTYFAIAGWAVLAGAPPRNEGALRTRALRMLIPVAIWTTIYLAWGRWRHTNADPTSDLALQAIFGSIRPAYHLWYFYAHIPLILLLGFLILVKAGQRPWGVGAALLTIAAAPTALGDLATLTGWDVPHFAWGFGVYQVTYAALGTLLLTLPPTRHRGRWCAAAAIALAAVVWSQHHVHFVIPNASIFVAALTGAALLAANGLRVPERLRPALTRLTGAGLGAFMMHVLLLKTLSPWFISPDRGWLGAIAAATGLMAATALPCFAASLLWGRLGLRRYLG